MFSFSVCVSVNLKKSEVSVYTTPCFNDHLLFLDFISSDVLQGDFF